MQYYIETDFTTQNINNITTNDIPYYITNINEYLQQLDKSYEKTDIVFENLYSHFNDDYKYILYKEINIIQPRNNLFNYIDTFINDDLFKKFVNNEIIEAPLIFVKAFYNRFNKYKLTIFKSKFFNKYIDSVFICKSEILKNQNIIHDKIKSFNEFEDFFNDNINKYLISYCNKVYEATNYLNNNNFYGQQTNKYKQNER